MSTKEKAEVSKLNQILIDKKKLKEEHKAELKAITDAFEQQCLLSFSTNRSGEVIKKFNFPTFVPYEESQKEDRMIHQMNQVIGHALRIMLQSWPTTSTMLCSRRYKIEGYLALWD